MQSLLRKLSEIDDKDDASRRLLNSNFRSDIGVALESPSDTVATIKGHQDKNQILRGLVYMLPLSLPLLRLFPANELSAEKVREGFSVVSQAMEDTLTDYSDLLNLPGSKQQEALITQARSVEEQLQQLQDEHLKKKKELVAEQTLLEKRKKQIIGLKSQITSLEEKLAKEKQAITQASEEEKKLRDRLKKTGTELEGQREKMEQRSKYLHTIRQELKKIEANKKYKPLIKKMDELLKEVISSRPDDELSTLAAGRK